jgi:hypothetical protein
MTRTSARRAMIIGLALISIVVSFPRKAVVAPAYFVTVSDPAGHGLAGVVVRRYIQDYSSGRNLDNSIDAKTDLRGHAYFPEEDHRISVVAEILGCAKQVLEAGAHASCGVYSDISVSDNHLVEAARLEKSLQHATRSLILTMSACPSGDYRACTESAHRQDH